MLDLDTVDSRPERSGHGYKGAVLFREYIVRSFSETTTVEFVAERSG
jgi:hypothetical protein